MATFDTVNYSLRPNKAIQRSIVFEIVRSTVAAMEVSNPVYIGFGSVWFTDFHIAHKALEIGDLVSIEADEIGYKRAKFNKPFKCIDVRHGWSCDVIPEIGADSRYGNRPWIVWLDYDDRLSEDSLQEIYDLTTILPHSSQLFVTFNAVPHKYGKPRQIDENLRALFGDGYPDDVDRELLGADRLQRFLGQLTLDSLQSAAIANGRPGGFVPSCLLPYRDGAPMVTVGGCFPEPAAREAAKAHMHNDRRGFPDLKIETPPLTLKESAALQASLPRTRPMTRGSLKRIGFDLKEEQIRSFQEFYRYYPHFAQLSS
ncbi:conserved hypothetical protein [Maricaulis maris MCS10]|uniref:Uncharacterized protein n=1 Tax=Maricaulis maris (strain MCS10) TaxID=394221 RepID=Q0AMN3_MARMM|nr:O-methyltransferase [Maricaulis maris]ABI66454.1 conserved hypothetical protein [Maricaulis maris MCS10]